MTDTERETPKRASSTQHYQTFSTPPPKSSGHPFSRNSTSSSINPPPDSADAADENEENTPATPIPVRQMAVLAFVALCEQTALNSISPYLPSMAASFPGVRDSEIGMYVGTIASSFALAQFATNFFWGWLSDHIGRKPVILLGTILTAVCFLAFGFCKTLWQAILVQTFMGIVNGNQGVVSTCLGEITDRSNQSRAFTYLPVIYGIGGITGPILGGLLVAKEPNLDKEYPYLAPNLASAAILVLDFIVISVFLEESVENAKFLPEIRKKFRDLFTWMWQFTSSTRPTYMRNYAESDYPSHRRHQPRRGSGDHSDSDSISTIMPLLQNRGHDILNRDEVFNRDMILLLLTYLIFALSNVSFGSLYTIFVQSPAPIGRDFTARETGATLAFAGVVTIIFQICIFGKLRDKMGNRWSYRAGLLGFAVSFFLMPFIGYKDGAARDGKPSTHYLDVTVEVCIVLLIKTVSTVGGLTSALLLVRIYVPLHSFSLTFFANSLDQITNSAPDHVVLGSLNGLAQTLAAAGRAAGPFLSGSLFSLSTRVKIKPEALAFGVFGAVSIIGFLLSFGIRSRNLEDDGWCEEQDDDDDDDDDERSKSGDDENHV